MTRLLLIALTLGMILATPLQAQQDKLCVHDECQFLTVRQGLVHFIDFPPLSRNLVLGRYAASYQGLVPATEAPLRGARSSDGWVVVVAAFLDHTAGGQSLRVRMYSPDGTRRGPYEVMAALEEFEFGDIFGTADKILAITSTEEHAYNVKTNVWLLQDNRIPKQLMDTPAVLLRPRRREGGRPAGLTIRRQTYDGLHAETKGWAEEFWIWDPTSKSLTLADQR